NLPVIVNNDDPHYAVTALNQVVFNRYVAHPLRQALERGEISIEAGKISRNDSYDAVSVMTEAIATRPTQMMALGRFLNALDKRAFSQVEHLYAYGKWKVYRIEVDLYDESMVLLGFYNPASHSYDLGLCISDQSLQFDALVKKVKESNHKVAQIRPALEAIDLEEGKLIRRSSLILSENLLLCGEGLSNGKASGRLVAYPYEPAAGEDIILVVRDIDQNTLAWIQSHPQVKGVIQIETRGNIASHISLSLQAINIPRIQVLASPETGNPFYMSSDGRSIEGVRLARYQYAPTRYAYIYQALPVAADSYALAHIVEAVLDAESGEVYVLDGEHTRLLELYRAVLTGKFEEASALRASLTDTPAAQELLEALYCEEGARNSRALVDNLESVERVNSVMELAGYAAELAASYQHYEQLSALASWPVHGESQELYQQYRAASVAQTGKLMRRSAQTAQRLLDMSQWTALEFFLATTLAEESDFIFSREIEAPAHLREVSSRLFADALRRESELKKQFEHKISILIPRFRVWLPALIGGKGSLLSVTEEIKDRVGFDFKMQETLVLTTVLYEGLIEEFSGRIQAIVSGNESAPAKLESIKSMLVAAAQEQSSKTLETVRRIAVVLKNREILDAGLFERSSNVREDLQENKPGKFVSVPNVITVEGVVNAFIEVVVSNIAAVMIYNTVEPSAMAVMLQHQVRADASGVLLIDAQQAIINAGYGLCGGTQEVLDADMWKYSYTHDSWQFARGEKAYQLVPNASAGRLERIENSEELRMQPCLERQIPRKLVEMGKTFYGIAKFPLNIEFAIVDNTIHVLQMRKWYRIGTAYSFISANADEIEHNHGRGGLGNISESDLSGHLPADPARSIPG
ncbi:MAG: PEP/pyruvate-binding domain-containing protein, partial [Candidatus Omnitrophota bacterium]